MSLDLVERYHPYDEDQGEVKSRMLAFQAENPDAFWRRCEKGHFTASALVVSEDQKVLLLYHRKLAMWLQFGGHCDGETNFLSVAMREAREESGLDDLKPLCVLPLDLDIHDIPAQGVEPAHQHFDVRFVLMTKVKGYVPNSEGNVVRWYDLGSLPEIDLSLTRLINRYLERNIE